jgi:hypothetical protein
MIAILSLSLLSLLLNRLRLGRVMLASRVLQAGRRMALTLLALAPVLAPAQGPPRPGVDPGPWDHDVWLYRLWPDGASERVAIFERSGVPSLIRVSAGRLMAAHQWFPESDAAAFDKVAVRFSGDDGLTWSVPRVIDVVGLPDDQRFPFDPTLLQLPDGRIRLYFTTNRARTFEQDRPWIASALSTDGVRFVVEPGARLAIPGETVIDCAAVLHRELFHLYSPIQTGRGLGYHAVSRDGLSFERLANVSLPEVRWLGAALSSGAAIRFYGTRDPGLWSASSSDGAAWSPPATITLQGADPGVVELPDGSRFFLVTGPPRPGTPSAGRMSRRPPQGLPR